SNPNFSAANSRMYGLYRSSVGDVRLDPKPTGCVVITFSPLGDVDKNCCERTAPNPSL
ncbi:hypothetical protein PAXINDRAFT_61307, partial [Paxillus involutus ATCC 200175]